MLFDVYSQASEKMVEQGAETPSPIQCPGQGGPGLPVPGDEGLRRDTQRKGGDDNSEDPRKAQGRVEEPLRQEDGDLRGGEGQDPFGVCRGVGSGSSRGLGPGEGVCQVSDGSRFLRAFRVGYLG